MNDDGEIWIYSIKDIEEGEELTYDYGYDMEHFLITLACVVQKLYRIHCS